MSKVLLYALMMGLLACSATNTQDELTWDTSSRESLLESAVAIITSLEGDDEELFRKAIRVIEDHSRSQLTPLQQEELPIEELEAIRFESLRFLDGMTAQETIAHAQTLPNWPLTEEQVEFLLAPHGDSLLEFNGQVEERRRELPTQAPTAPQRR